jgi:tRNA-Thr(GGU) m(6)t(6)A37 methyltransferase TsaA
MNAVNYTFIGVIHSPYKKPQGVPIQSSTAKDVEGTVEVYPRFAEGLKDLDGFSHVFLVYHFHLAGMFSLHVKPYLDDRLHGVFATRAPARPNPIGISIVRLAKVEGNILHVKDVDIVDGTPLLDIKPYVPKFDYRETEKIGWLRENLCSLQDQRDNGRFTKHALSTIGIRRKQRALNQKTKATRAISCMFLTTSSGNISSL